MKHIKTFETIIYSNDVNYEQVYKPKNINNYFLSVLNSFKFKLDDYVKIDENDIKFKYNENVIDDGVHVIYVIKAIDIIKPFKYNIFKINEEINFNEDGLWVYEENINLATEEEVENYYVKLDAYKYNL
jgi:hypothetical protein